MKKQNQPRSVKTLKGQLFGAVAMIVVAAVALGTSTYAWFINNQTVEVETMKLQVSTSTSLLVALGKQAGMTTATGAIVNWTGDKSIITNGDIDGKTVPIPADSADWADFFVNQMIPATATTASLESMQPKFFSTNNHVSDGKLDQFILRTFDPAIAEDVGQGGIKRLPLKFSASSDMDVYFGKDALDSIDDLVTAVTGAATVNGKDAAAQRDAVAKALRMAIIPYTDGTDYNSAIAVRTFQFEDGTLHITTPGNNTHYNGVTTGTQDEEAGTYAAIAGVDGDGKVTSVGALQALVPGHGTAAKNGNKTIATKNATTGNYDKPAADPMPLFSLKAGKPRQVDVYFWLEGTDQDCLNELSSYHFGLNLPFASVLTPVVPTP